MTPQKSTAPDDDSPPVHVIVCTHTAERLDLVLRAVAGQDHAPRTVSVSVDGDIEGIARICRAHADHAGQSVLLSQRRFNGAMRLAQSRNNAVRTLISRGHRHGLLLFFDGDIVPASDTVRVHARLARHRGLTIGQRINLDREQTNQLLATGILPRETDLADEHQRLEREQRRTSRNLLLRRLGLARPHKPNIIGAHFAVDFALFETVNGFDEDFVGYGCEDDDFARRVYRAGGHVTSAILATRVHHLFHPPRSAARHRDNPGRARFERRSWTTVCGAGLRTPRPQHPVFVTESDTACDVCALTR